jgi:hypothetical protein
MAQAAVKRPKPTGIVTTPLPARFILWRKPLDERRRHLSIGLCRQALRGTSLQGRVECDRRLVPASAIAARSAAGRLSQAVSGNSRRSSLAAPQEPNASKAMTSRRGRRSEPSAWLLAILMTSSVDMGAAWARQVDSPFRTVVIDKMRRQKNRPSTARHSIATRGPCRFRQVRGIPTGATLSALGNAPGDASTA